MTEIPHRKPSTAACTPAGSRLAGRAWTREELEQKVRAEYRALPRLSLTLGQAHCLWNVPVSCCHDVLDGLIAEGVLVLTKTGLYVRADMLPAFEAPDAALTFQAAG
jgi:hypothetical protein